MSKVDKRDLAKYLEGNKKASDFYFPPKTRKEIFADWFDRFMLRFLEILFMGGGRRRI